MKSEPLITYNHMNEEETVRNAQATHQNRSENYPISLYMLLVVDAVLITAILFMTAKIIF